MPSNKLLYCHICGCLLDADGYCNACEAKRGFEVDDGDYDFEDDLFRSKKRGK